MDCGVVWVIQLSVKGKANLFTGMQGCLCVCLSKTANFQKDQTLPVVNSYNVRHIDRHAFQLFQGPSIPSKRSSNLCDPQVKSRFCVTGGGRSMRLCSFNWCCLRQAVQSLLALFPITLLHHNRPLFFQKDGVLMPSFPSRGKFKSTKLQGLGKTGVSRGMLGLPGAGQPFSLLHHARPKRWIEHLKLWKCQGLKGKKAGNIGFSFSLSFSRSF